jgi:hypothetical protein
METPNIKAAEITSFFDRSSLKKILKDFKIYIKPISSPTQSIVVMFSTRKYIPISGAAVHLWTTSFHSFLLFCPSIPFSTSFFSFLPPFLFTPSFHLLLPPLASTLYLFSPIPYAFF